MLHYEVERIDSEAPWLVYIHGAGGSIATWKYQRDLGRQLVRNSILIDLRDHGKSQAMQGPDRYSFDLIISDILEVLDHEGIKQADFMSLSFGSVLLQHLALRSPGRVRAAITAGGIFRGNFQLRTFVHLARFFNLFLPYRYMYSVFSYLLMPRQRHQVSRRIYRMQARKISPAAYMRWVGLYGEFFRLLKRFWNQRITFPLLIVMGSEDYVFLPAARRFAAKRDNVMIEVIAGAGHICNIDKPDQFNAVCGTFLASVDLPADAPVQETAKIRPE